MARDDQELLAGLVDELRRGKDVQIELSAPDAFSLVACLQLAWRHPRLGQGQKVIIELCVRRLMPTFEGMPTVQQAIKAGWDTSQDQP